MSVRTITGDCREVLRTLESESVHCCVTSPPYFGLRDYGTAKWEGGDATCDHVERDAADVSRSNGLGKIPGYRDSLPPENAAFKAMAKQFSSTCGKCGATRIDSQIGLEPTPEAYVAELVDVFREVKRVLRKDGTCWLNLGDSYASSIKGANNNGEGGSTLTSGARPHVRSAYNDGRGRDGHSVECGVAPKNLLGMPWRVAFALQADGWYLRQDIIWSKPNPMPESVRDRCTKAHEYLFLLSKSERYYYDADAVSEPDAGITRPNFDGKRGLLPKSAERSAAGGDAADRMGSSGTRNKRSVWEVTTAPFSEAHFATFPPALIEPCIKAGCPVGGTTLDPFGGAGTTGLVADRLQRSAILIELNPDYADMARRRMENDAPLFLEAAE